jgi:hypothetical protein
VTSVGQIDDESEGRDGKGGVRTDSVNTCERLVVES